MNLISSIVWIKRGAGKMTPIKLVPEKDELETMLGKPLGEDEDEEEEDSKNIMETTAGQDVETRYQLDDYDNEQDDLNMPGIGPIAVHASNTDDPLLEIKDEGEDSDADDYFIKPDDNLIVAAHIEDDSSSLEVYVYNDREGYLYVHHDILMLNMPLCLTWLDFDRNETQPVNYVAVGSMEGVIELFDIDLVDQLEPLHTFGKKKRKSKKKKSSSKTTSSTSGEGHDNAVLDLQWNKLVRQILASSSADETILLWDLNQMKIAAQIKNIHEKQIQSICWHPTEPQNLLSGSSDRTVCLIDCRNSSQIGNRWTYDSEIERIIWNTFDSNQYLASTENGFVYLMDIRNSSTPVFSISAHNAAVTGLCMNSVPGFLLTSSFDETLKIWDIDNGQVSYIAERKFQSGQINTCLVNPDYPFTFAFGGHAKGVTIWDCTENADVRSRFGSRTKFEVVEIDEVLQSAKVTADETPVSEIKSDSMTSTLPATTISSSSYSTNALKSKRKKFAKKT